MSKQESRREFLKLLAIAFPATVLAACTPTAPIPKQKDEAKADNRVTIGPSHIEAVSLNPNQKRALELSKYFGSTLTFDHLAIPLYDPKTESTLEVTDFIVANVMTNEELQNVSDIVKRSRTIQNKLGLELEQDGKNVIYPEAIRMSSTHSESDELLYKKEVHELVPLAVKYTGREDDLLKPGEHYVITVLPVLGAELLDLTGTEELTFTRRGTDNIMYIDIAQEFDLNRSSRTSP